MPDASGSFTCVPSNLPTAARQRRSRSSLVLRKDLYCRIGKRGLRTEIEAAAASTRVQTGSDGVPDAALIIRSEAGARGATSSRRRETGRTSAVTLKTAFHRRARQKVLQCESTSIMCHVNTS
jgi:hypothetical protein